MPLRGGCEVENGDRPNPSVWRGARTSVLRNAVEGLIEERVRSGVVDSLVAGPRFTMSHMAVRPWPDFPEEDQWVLRRIEEQIAESAQSPAQMRARATELRERAAEVGRFGGQDALLAVAERYEEAAARPRVS